MVYVKDVFDKNHYMCEIDDHGFPVKSTKRDIKDLVMSYFYIELNFLKNNLDDLEKILLDGWDGIKNWELSHFVENYNTSFETDYHISTLRSEKETEPRTDDLNFVKGNTYLVSMFSEDVSSEVSVERTVRFNGNWSNVCKFSTDNIQDGLYFIDSNCSDRDKDTCTVNCVGTGCKYMFVGKMLINLFDDGEFDTVIREEKHKYFIDKIKIVKGEDE